jgi:ACT domain-containing protein
MPLKLGADDIARIAASVMEKLGKTDVDPQALSRAVQAAAAKEETVSTPRAIAPPKEPPRDGTRRRIILASFGLNRPGIVAAVSAVLAENNCSIEDMSQRIMQEFYTLIMIVDISASKAEFAELSEKLKSVEQKLGVTILVQHEDVFRFMHRV